MFIDSTIRYCDQRMPSVSPATPTQASGRRFTNGSPADALNGTSRRVFDNRLNTQATVDRAHTTKAAREEQQCFEVGKIHVIYNKKVGRVSAYRYKSSTRLPSARRPSSSTCRALIVAPVPVVQNLGGETYQTSCESNVSLHTRLTQPTPPLSTTPQAPTPGTYRAMDDANTTVPQQQLISNARTVPIQTQPENTCRLSTSTITANDSFLPYSSSDNYVTPQQPTYSPLSDTFLQDLDDIPLYPIGESHDEYSMYNDFTASSSSTYNFVSDPFIESAAIPEPISQRSAVPIRAISSEEEILSNIEKSSDLNICDMDKVDIGELMKYLHGDSPGFPGIDDEIFERVDQEPTTPESIGQPVSAHDYFAVPSTSAYRRAQDNTQDLGPVQEFFPEMCVELSTTTTTGYDHIDYGSTIPDWESYAQYSPSRTTASVTSSCSSTTYRPPTRKRQYPAPSVSTIYDDDDYRTKRNKNNKASAVSRQKHKEKVEKEKKDVVELETRNETLKLEVETLEQQIATMRAVLMDSISKAQK